MKVLFISVLALASSSVALAGTTKNSVKNCELVSPKGKTYQVHAKSEASCQKRKGKWVASATNAPTAAPTAKAPVAVPAKP